MPPHTLRIQFEQVLLDLHRSFHNQLADFDGDKTSLAVVQPLLHDCLTLEYRDPELSRPRTRWWPWLLLLALLSIALGWFWWQEQVWNQRLEATRKTLQQAPGIVLLSWRPGRRILVRLLVDPMAVDPLQLVTDPAILSRLEIERQTYIAADPSIVLARDAPAISVPQTVSHWECNKVVFCTLPGALQRIGSNVCEFPAAARRCPGARSIRTDAGSF